MAEHVPKKARVDSGEGPHYAVEAKRMGTDSAGTSAMAVDTAPDSPPAMQQRNYSPTGAVYGPTAVAEEMLALAARAYTWEGAAVPPRPTLTTRERLGGTADALTAEVLHVASVGNAGCTRLQLLRAIDKASGDCVAAHLSTSDAFDKATKEMLHRVRMSG